MTKLFTFFGADTKVGTTMTAHSFARALAKMYPDKMTILLHTDGDDGADYYKAEKGGFDDIKFTLLKNCTKASEISEICDKKDNLWILPGFSDYLSYSWYEPSDFWFLINLLDGDFDFIVVDGGANLNSALTVGALDNEHKPSTIESIEILVTNQQPKSLKEFKKRNENVFRKVNFSFDYLLVNRYQEVKVLPIYQQVAKNYGFEECFVLSNVAGGAALIAEIDQKTMFELDPKRYQKEIMFFAEFLTSEESK